MTSTQYRQLRGLLIAWRNRPQWLREPPQLREHRHGGSETLIPGIRIRERITRTSNYRRVMLPAFGHLSGPGSIKQHRGRCRWCKLPIPGAPSKLWDEDCLPAYWAATGQQGAVNEHLTREFRRDNQGMNPACEQCGEATWVQLNHVHDRYPDHESYLWRRKIGKEWSVEARHVRGGAEQIELDHRDALSVAWVSGNERRLLRALTLGNLQHLCRSCHIEKTADDRRRMNNLLTGRPEEWKAKTPEPSRKAAMNSTPAEQKRLL